MPLDVWSSILRCLRAGEPIAVATIVTRDGSTPSSAGAKLLAGEGGLVAGTLGGGKGEALALEAAELTIHDGEPRRVEVDMSGEASSGADLICGGRVDIYVQKIPPEWIGVFEELYSRIGGGVHSLLLTPLSGEKPELVEVNSMPASWGEVVESGCAGIVEHNGTESLLEQVRSPVRLILAGGGHVSFSVSRMAEWAGFSVTVLDDRVEFANPERFPYIARDRIHVVPAYKDCFEESRLGFRVTGLCCIAILTRGHAFDGEVLAQALGTGAGYIGMIGSARKREGVYAALRERGFGEDDFRRVRCPIGLPLGGKSPEDIAVSIMAELVSVRAKGLQMRKRE